MLLRGKKHLFRMIRSDVTAKSLKNCQCINVLERLESNNVIWCHTNASEGEPAAIAGGQPTRHGA